MNSWIHPTNKQWIFYLDAEEKNETKMNIRISAAELQKIKARAEAEGLKYQTFIKSVLHRYLTGQLVDRRHAVAS